MIKHSIQYLFCLCILLQSCKSNPDKKIIPGWTSELLGPLVKTKVTGEQVLQLQDLSFFSFSTVYDFNYGNPGQPDVVPEIDLPPFTKRETLNAQFISMELESGTMYFHFSNTLEFDIKKGAIVLIVQEGATLLADTLKADIPAHTGVYNSKTISLAGKTIYPVFDLSVSNLGTHGTNGAPLVPGDKKLVINLFIQKVSFKSLTLAPGSYAISDTAAFNLNGKAVGTEAVSGDLYTYVKNKFPFTTDLQFYFMDALYTRQDSLFSSNLTIPPSTPSDTEFVHKQSFTEAKIPFLQKSSFLNSVMRFYSAQNVTIRKENDAEIQLVGDLKISVNK